MHPRLKKIIFNKLYEDLKHVEIIHFENSIWFIDREKKYWYLQYEKSGYLWWRFDFFPRFFRLFSMERSEFELVIADWVEEVLNYKVCTTTGDFSNLPIQVEEVLNFKVNTTSKANFSPSTLVEEVLNFKVDITHNSVYYTTKVEEVLNFKVNTILDNYDQEVVKVKEILNLTL